MVRRIGTVRKRKPTGKPATYPWERWCDGNAYRALQGVDFEGKPKAFANACYQHAWRHGMKVTCAVYSDAVEFQFTNGK